MPIVTFKWIPKTSSSKACFLNPFFDKKELLQRTLQFLWFNAIFNETHKTNKSNSKKFKGRFHHFSLSGSHTRIHSFFLPFFLCIPLHHILRLYYVSVFLLLFKPIYISPTTCQLRFFFLISKRCKIWCLSPIYYLRVFNSSFLKSHSFTGKLFFNSCLRLTKSKKNIDSKN